MSITSLAFLVDRLPPGRARRRYERLLSEIGGEMVAVTVPYADGALWFVTGIPQARALSARGVPRSRIWTLSEANSVLEACASPADTVRKVARSFGGGYSERNLLQAAQQTAQTMKERRSALSNPENTKPTGPGPKRPTVRFRQLIRVPAETSRDALFSGVTVLALSEEGVVYRREYSEDAKLTLWRPQGTVSSTELEARHCSYSGCDKLIEKLPEDWVSITESNCDLHRYSV